VSQYTQVLGISTVPCETFKYESDPERAFYEIDTHKKYADLKFVFGWDQPLMSFYLQIHDAFALDPDENPVIWLGATQDTIMYDIDDFVKVAQRYGLQLTPEMRTGLYADRDDGR
jgi:hypothetical protein